MSTRRSGNRTTTGCTRSPQPRLSDHELLNRVRAGHTTDFGSLYQRHFTAATNYARSLTRCGDDAADVVAEAFTRILDLLQRGRGPVSEFRPYLFRSIRNLATDNHRREQRVEVADELDDTIDTEPVDHLLRQADGDAVRRAFDSLPKTWSNVLWLVEVKEQRPRHLAEELETTPHNVSALAHRAREGLRNAYLSESNRHSHPGCERVVNRLGAFVRGTVGSRERRRIETHLDRCELCCNSAENAKAQLFDLRLDGMGSTFKAAS